MSKKFIHLIALITVLWSNSCSRVIPLKPVKDLNKIPTVRVLIHQTSQTATLNAAGMIYIFDEGIQRIVDSVPAGETISLLHKDKGMLEISAGKKRLPAMNDCACNQLIRMDY